MKKFAFVLAGIFSLFASDIASAQCSNGSCAAPQRHGLLQRIHDHRHPATVADAQTLTFAPTNAATPVAPVTLGKLAALDGPTKTAIAQIIANRIIAAGRMTAAEYQTILTAYTVNGAVNWTGVIAFFNAIVADLPQILALIQVLIPLFGG